MKYFTSYVYSLCFMNNWNSKLNNRFKIQMQNIQKIEIVIQSYN